MVSDINSRIQRTCASEAAALSLLGCVGVVEGIVRCHPPWPLSSFPSGPDKPLPPRRRLVVTLGVALVVFTLSGGRHWHRLRIMLHGSRSAGCGPRQAHLGAVASSPDLTPFECAIRLGPAARWPIGRALPLPYVNRRHVCTFPAYETLDITWQLKPRLPGGNGHRSSAPGSD